MDVQIRESINFTVTDVEIRNGACDFRVMSRKYVDALLQLKEYNRFSKGLFSWVGFKVKWIEFENAERAAGNTKWSFWSLVKYSIEGIMAFTTTWLMVSSVVSLLLCLCTLSAVFYRASLVCLSTFVGGCQMFFFGIMGQYMAKMYLENKRRSVYIVDEEPD